MKNKQQQQQHASETLLFVLFQIANTNRHFACYPHDLGV